MVTVIPSIWPCAEFLEDGERIEQRLGGVLAHTVACVEHRLPGRRRRDGRRADLGVAQHDHVCVAFQRADGIRQAFALRDRRVFHLVDRDDAAAQPFHGRRERRRGARGRFVEQVGQDLAFQQVERADALDHAAHLVRHAEHVLQVGAAELLDGQDVLAVPGRVGVVAKRQVGGLGISGHKLVSLFGS